MFKNRINRERIILRSFYKHLKFGDGDGPNLCRVNKVDVSSHLMKIYFGLQVYPRQFLRYNNHQTFKVLWL